jgi:hypothetical protein
MSSFPGKLPEPGEGQEKTPTELTLAAVKAEWRQQWEDELLSDEAVNAAAEEMFVTPSAITRQDARAGLQAAIAATQKGGE